MQSNNHTSAWLQGEDILNKKFIFIGLAILVLVVFMHTDVSLDATKQFVTDYKTYVQENLILSGVLFFVSYVAMTALSIPGAALMTLLAGALFGVVFGVVLVSFASTIGATIMFLLSRYFFAETFHNKFPDVVTKVNQHVEKDGTLYILTLRLIPTIPFFVVNGVSGLTNIPIAQYYLYSQIGMFPATVLYVNAGTQLSKIENMADILSPTLLLSFVALGLMPIAFKFILGKFKHVS